MTNELAAVSLPPEDVADYLTAEEAAAIIKTTVTELVAQAQTFQVPALWCMVEGAADAVPLFTLHFVRRIAAANESVSPEMRMLVIPLYNLLQDYVKAHPPVMLYRDAVQYDLPWLGRAGSRWGRLHVHVSVDAVAAFATEVQADVRLRAAGTVVTVLKMMRAQNVKGARDTNGNRVPRAAWRLPLTVVDPGEGEQS